MGSLLLDRPWEAERTVAAMEAWIAKLDELRAYYAGDEEALADINSERASAERGLQALRARDEAGISPPEDDDFAIEPDE